MALGGTPLAAGSSERSGTREHGGAGNSQNQSPAAPNPTRFDLMPRLFFARLNSFAPVTFWYGPSNPAARAAASITVTATGPSASVSPRNSNTSDVEARRGE